MEKVLVNFDMKAMAAEMPAYVRGKAIRAGSCIIYAENGNIIKEDPRIGEKTILQQVEEKTT